MQVPHAGWRWGCVKGQGLWLLGEGGQEEAGQREVVPRPRRAPEAREGVGLYLKCT